MSGWYLTFQAVLPGSGGATFWEVGIHEKKIRLLQENGHITKLARIRLVEETFEDTIVLVRGWSRPGKENCLIYVSKPKCDYRSASISTPPPPGMRFAVFVLPDGTIDDWAWRQQSENDPDIPQGVEGEIIWP